MRTRRAGLSRWRICKITDLSVQDEKRMCGY
jgi:hypothetical protein